MFSSESLIQRRWSVLRSISWCVVGDLKDDWRLLFIFCFACVTALKGHIFCTRRFAYTSSFYFIIFIIHQVLYIFNYLMPIEVIDFWMFTRISPHLRPIDQNDQIYGYLDTNLRSRILFFREQETFMCIVKSIMIPWPWWLFWWWCWYAEIRLCLLRVTPRYLIFSDHFIGMPLIFINGIYMILLSPKIRTMVLCSLILRSRF